MRDMTVAELLGVTTHARLRGISVQQALRLNLKGFVVETRSHLPYIANAVMAETAYQAFQLLAPHFPTATFSDVNVTQV